MEKFRQALSAFWLGVVLTVSLLVVVSVITCSSSVDAAMERWGYQWRKGQYEALQDKSIQVEQP